jgi:molecular chaperone IbpA
MTSPYTNGGYPNKDPHSERFPSPWDNPHKRSPSTIEPTVAEVTITSIFPQFNRWAIGFDPLLETFKQASTGAKTGGYPPYNIFKYKDNYVLEIAVAGFAKEDIKISVQELTLTVEGVKLPSVDEYVHKGIANRDFKQDFVLAEYIVVTGAELKDGLLRIILEQELPEALQPKVINIK